MVWQPERQRKPTKQTNPLRNNIAHPLSTTGSRNESANPLMNIGKRDGYRMSTKKLFYLPGCFKIGPNV
jgi:hypothetical protein